MKTAPYFVTQGGGKVVDAGGLFIFIEKPDCPGLEVGDVKPDEWDMLGPFDENGKRITDFFDPNDPGDIDWDD